MCLSNLDILVPKAYLANLSNKAATIQNFSHFLTSQRLSPIDRRSQKQETPEVALKLVISVWAQAVCTEWMETRGKHTSSHIMRTNSRAHAHTRRTCVLLECSFHHVLDDLNVENNHLDGRHAADTCSPSPIILRSTDPGSGGGFLSRRPFRRFSTKPNLTIRHGRVRRPRGRSAAVICTPR